MTVCMYRDIHTTTLYYWPHTTRMPHLKISCMPLPISTCGKYPWLSTGQEIEWDRNPMWTLRRGGNPSFELEVRPVLWDLAVRRPVATPETRIITESGKGIEMLCLTKFCSVAKKKWRKFVFWYVTPFRLVNIYWRSNGRIAFTYNRVSNLFVPFW